MKRIEKQGKKHLIGYHTQEYRGTTLENPISCQAANAWLGIGYYFWTEMEFAQYWGEDFKKGKAGTGYYDVYQAELDIENCINAVFDEEGYFFLREKIEYALGFLQRSGKEITLQKVHRFLADNFWGSLGVTGIIYDDKPSNPAYKRRIYSEIPDLYYKKRIQVVLFNTRNIHNFELVLEEQS